jgi:hypothetical protein
VHSARLAYCGLAHVAMRGLAGVNRRPARAAHKPARPTRAQCLGALEHVRDRAWLMQQPVVRAPWSIVVRPAVSGYGMSHGKVFTMSTQGAR